MVCSMLKTYASVIAKIDSRKTRKMKFLAKSIIGTCFIILTYLNICASDPRSAPVFYNFKNAKISTRLCQKDSLEIFYNDVAQPSLTLLYHRGKALFGILMDKIEASSDPDSDALEKTKNQLTFISETVSTSLDSAVDRLEAEWELLVKLSDTKPLPWENHLKVPLTHEVLGGLEYAYLMVEAVIRSGVKEIVGMLQHQLVHVIRTLESEISKLPEKDGDSELKLLKLMKRGLSKMRPTFTTKLLEKVLAKALGEIKYDSSSKTFVADTLDQMAIVLHAFREKGLTYPKFWKEITPIFKADLGKIDDDDDMGLHVSKFIEELMADENKLINIIIQLISRDNNVQTSI